MSEVWIFHESTSKYSGGVFESLIDAEDWIKKNKLNGMLTKYPLNSGVFDWAIENDMHNIKSDKVKDKASNPKFVGGFTTASQEHYHYQDGHLG